MTWKLGPPVLRPGPAGSFDETSVKDPSVVRHGGRWHVFYTARGNGEYGMGYVAAPDWESLDQASRTRLDALRGHHPYACAPQVFFLSTRGVWVLIFQTEEERYGPVFSTSSDLSDPAGWSPPRPLLAKDDGAKWIDFWTIFDGDGAYLFYTRDHWDVVVRKTSRDAFPEGWGPPKTVLSGVHEAVHVYKAHDRAEFHMFSEMKGTDRWFAMARAPSPEGPWETLAERYADGSMLRGEDWTDMVSHGEIIRCGHDERLEYDPTTPRWLIQGLRNAEYREPYSEMPWRLGIMEASER